MALNRDDMIKQCLVAISKNKLIFKEDIYAYVPFSKQTFYDHGLDKVDSIKESLEHNKTEIKNGLRAKWYKSDNPTVQIALYKLTASEEERRLLATNYQEQTTRTEQPLFPDDAKKDDSGQ
jgi:hypothetical protein